MDPRKAVSPKNRLDPNSLNILYTHPEGWWSLARMTWDEEPAVAMRWNGDIHDDHDLGNPRSHGMGTWFVLPTEVGEPLAMMATAFGSAFDLSTLG